MATSAADLKFRSVLPRARDRNFKSNAAPESWTCQCSFGSEVRKRGCRDMMRTSEALGARQVASAGPSAMQLKSHRHRKGATVRSVRYLPTDLCNRLQRLNAQRRTVVLAHAARAAHRGRSGAGFGSILRVEAIPRFNSSFPKAWDGLRASLRPALRSYNCGACRPTVGGWGRRNPFLLADTCMVPRFTGS